MVVGSHDYRDREMRVIGIPYESGAAHPGPSLGPVHVKQMIDSGNPDIGTVHMGMVPIHAGGGR